MLILSILQFFSRRLRRLCHPTAREVPRGIPGSPEPLCRGNLEGSILSMRSLRVNPHRCCRQFGDDRLLSFRRYISSGLRWIWNGVASRRVTLSRSVLPGDLIMPPDADTPFIVQNDEDARRYTLSQVVIPLNLLDKSLLPTSIGNFPSAIIATIHEAGDLTEIIPREKFRPLVSHARSVYIDPVDGGALRASFTLNSGSYADVAMREVCGDQILCKSEEGPRKVELNLLRMFPDICFL